MVSERSKASSLMERCGEDENRKEMPMGVHQRGEELSGPFL